MAARRRRQAPQVLWVDDDVASLQGGELLLGALGCVVVAVPRTSLALAMLLGSEERGLWLPDLVLCAHRPPTLDALELVGTLAEEGHRVRIWLAADPGYVLPAPYRGVVAGQLTLPLAPVPVRKVLGALQGASRW